MSRLLAQALADALRAAGMDRTPCSLCGGVTRASARILVVGERHRLRRCEACRAPLNEQGRPAGSIGPNGQVREPILVYFEGPPTPAWLPRAS